MSNYSILSLNLIIITSRICKKIIAIIIAIVGKLLLFYQLLHTTNLVLHF